MSDDERKPELVQALGELRIDIDDVPWLVKDFHVLYRAALDVSESIVDPERETPPQRFLRAQLARLRPAFEQCEAVRAGTLPPRQG